MSNLLAGLDSMGLGDLSGMDIYAKQDKEPFSVSKVEEEIEKEEVIKEEDFILDKTFQCPVCAKTFKSKIVKTGKNRVVGHDTDLRPLYKYVDALKYDAIVCTNCGYSALSRYFTNMTATYARIIKESISSNFVNNFKDTDIYTYDEAITRHKLALLNSVMKRAKNSEKAYTCIKIAWLLRGKAQTIDIDVPDIAEQIRNIRKEEMEFIEKAYEGFVTAFSTEIFPMCGFDEATCCCIVADLARMLGNYKDAKMFASKALLVKGSSDRIREQARDLKEIIMEEIKSLE